MKLGKHTLKAWSNTQDVIALSSGEAEYYGLVRCAAQGFGVIALLIDMGIERKLKLKTDASVAKSIAWRRGLGKLRHISTQSLWVQQRVRDGSIELRKIRGEQNPADLFTKHLFSGADIESAELILSQFCCQRNWPHTLKPASGRYKLFLRTSL